MNPNSAPLGVPISSPTTPCVAHLQLLAGLGLIGFAVGLVAAAVLR